MAEDKSCFGKNPVFLGLLSEIFKKEINKTQHSLGSSTHGTKLFPCSICPLKMSKIESKMRNLMNSRASQGQPRVWDKIFGSQADPRRNRLKFIALQRKGSATKKRKEQQHQYRDLVKHSTKEIIREKPRDAKIYARKKHRCTNPRSRKSQSQADNIIVKKQNEKEIKKREGIERICLMRKDNEIVPERKLAKERGQRARKNI